MNNSNEELLEYLGSSITSEEKLVIDETVNEIESTALNLSNVTAQRWREFSIRRMLGSNSLRQGQRRDKASWDQVNSIIHEQLSLGYDLNIESIRALNKAINIDDGGEFRRSYSSAADKKFIAPSDVESFMNAFELFLIRFKEVDSLWRAFMIYSWGISIHPFKDGNGRTFRACSDWVLMGSNFLPLNFSSNVSAHVAIARNVELPKREDIFKTFAQGVINSYRFLAED